MMRTTWNIPIATALIISACGHGGTAQDANTNGQAAANANGTSALTRTQDDWHATDSLFKTMGGVQGKTVADLFVGDGYYTLKLLQAGAKVIALDDDPRNIELITAKKKELGISDDRLQIRQCTAGTPALSADEVDMALSTRPFLSIPDRVGYFTKVKGSVKMPRQVFIVDFLPVQSPVGPPMEQRVNEEQVMDAMEPCGFTDIGGYSKILPYRFVVQAMEFVEGPDAPQLPAGPGQPTQ